MRHLRPLMALIGIALAGCSGASTPSLTGAAGAAPAVPNDPVSRAFQVGTASSRAMKCGFHFDPAKLKAAFLAAEAAAGATPEDMARIEKNYDVSATVLTRTVAQEENYCTSFKLIKADLTRHLAGDFTPGPPHPKEEQEEGGLFDFALKPGASSTAPPSAPGYD